MAITIFEAAIKRKKTPNIFTIHSVATHHAPFRDNIRLFLRECSEKEDYNIRRNNSVWCTLFVSESNGVVFPLYTVEENVQRSSNPFCDLCRCVGWSHHFVSKRRYHMIIPEDDKWNQPLNKEFLELNTHLLHGLIHCNGFGHLISINGAKDSSNYLPGEEIMDFWDHICTSLHTQKISVHDLLMKKSMELRLLHGVAYGCSWFGKWGFKFCHGSFGVTEQKYSRGIQILSSLELKKIIHDFGNTSKGRRIQQIFRFYKNASETHLVTIGDLLQFMLAYASKPVIQKKTAMALAALSPNISTKTTHHQQISPRNSPLKYDSLTSFASKSNHRWTAERLERAAKAIVCILKEHKAANISLQELSDEARKQVGDTDLIEFLIRNIHKIIMDNQIVLRSIDPATRLSEFSLQDVVNRDEMGTTDSERIILAPEPGVDVYKDVLTLYENVFLGYPESHTVNLAARSILNSKNFVKEYCHFKGNEEDKLLKLHCRIMPTYDELVTELTRPLPPFELVMVPEGVTIGEVKFLVQRALRDTYYIMNKFVVKDIKMGQLENSEDLNQVQLGAGGCSVEVWVRGCGLDLDTELRYEGGAENWTVDCGCGAKDDDGERMVACDICQVWQHTRCSSIDDDEAVPHVFHCSRCSGRAS